MRGHTKLFVLQMDPEKARHFKAANAGAGVVRALLQEMVQQAPRGFTSGRT